MKKIIILVFLLFITVGCSTQKQPNEYLTNQKAYELGYKSSQVGLDENPYDHHFQTGFHLAWINGWLDSELVKKQYKDK